MDTFTFDNIEVPDTRTIAIHVCGIYPWVAARCPFCGYTSPRPGFEQECLEFLYETPIQRTNRMLALPFYRGKDIITYQSDGTPVVYTEEERDADKGRNWDKEEVQMLYSDTGDHHPGVLERLLNAMGAVVVSTVRWAKCGGVVQRSFDSSDATSDCREVSTVGAIRNILFNVAWSKLTKHEASLFGAVEQALENGDLDKALARLQEFLATVPVDSGFLTLEARDALDMLGTQLGFPAPRKLASE